MSKSIPDFIYNHQFDSALHRLIMCRIWMAGSSDCMGGRYISIAAFADFSCCSVDEFYDAIGLLASSGFLEIVKPSREALRSMKTNDYLGFILMPDWQVGDYETI
ncbi:TPA: transcriptional regulator [Salmonella enterica subsp. enterica serovar Eastbourne]|nr:transcriptional regulator [Salmonella enterica subsp. enterica serovar Eastbourne]HDN7576189.1 transcriptional regulator [Salmonella enterica subsp. enterica serovar Eastbourne]